MDQNLIAKLRERYKDVNPLLFHRSVERAKSPGDLFDILDTIPDKYPIIWSESLHKWIFTEDMYQAENFNTKNPENE